MEILQLERGEIAADGRTDGQTLYPPYTHTYCISFARFPPGTAKLMIPGFRVYGILGQIGTEVLGSGLRQDLVDALPLRYSL